MSLEDMIAQSGPRNFEAMRRGWFPNQDERQVRQLRDISIQREQGQLDYAPQKRQQEQQQADMQIQHKELVIKDIRQKMDIAKTIEDREILEDKETVLNHHTRGAKSILDKFGPQAARKYMSQNIDSWKDAAGPEQDKAMDQALAMDEQNNFLMPDDQFSQALEMVYLSRPIVQDELMKNRTKTRGEYYQLKDITVDGVTRPFVLNARTGELEPAEVSGDKVASPKYSPEVQGKIAQAKAGGKVRGKERTEAQIDLPRTRSNAKAIIGLVDEVLAHPAFSSVVGAPSLGKGLQYIPGTPEAGFKALLAQLKGKQFVQQYQDVLKGGGQITEIEGEKATQSYSRMTTALSEEEFKTAADEFKIEVNRLTALAEERATGDAPMAESKAMDYLKDNDTPENRQFFEDAYGHPPEF